MARPPRLLVLGSAYPPLAIGGYELLCRDHVRWLRRRGCAVTVLTTTYGLPDGLVRDEVGADGERVVRGLDLHWRDFRIVRPEGRELWLGEWRQTRLLRRVLDEARPDAALVWHMASVSKSLLATLHRHGVPMVAVVGEPWPAWDVHTDRWTGHWAEPPARLRARLLRPPLLPVVDRVVAPVDVRPAMDAIVPAYASAALRDQVEEGVPAWRGRGAVVLNGVDAARFDTGREDDAPLARPLRMLCAGRVERRKGVHTAVEALALLVEAGVDAVLRVVGWSDDAYAGELRTLAMSRGVSRRVTWDGAVDRDRLAGVYGWADALVFAPTWAEPFGLVPLEAMAGGCCVVATGTGGSAEYLRDGENCLLFTAEDAPGCAAAVRRLHDDHSLVRRLRAGGRATAAAHSFDAYAARLLDLVRQAWVARRSGRSESVSWS